MYTATGIKQYYLTHREYISFQPVQHKLKHLTFWSKRISSRTEPWHRWKSGLVSARKKNWLKAWLSTFFFLLRKMALSGLSLAMNASFSVLVWKRTSRKHWRTGVWGKLSLRRRLEAITKHDHKTLAIQTRVLYTNLSSMCSYRKFLRPFLRNALNLLLKQASERASYTLLTLFPPSLIRTRTRFMFQSRAPPFYTAPPRLSRYITVKTNAILKPTSKV